MADISDIPKISITQDNDDEISDCPSDVDIKGACTDIEDFDSNDEGTCRANMIKSLKKTCKKSSPAVTDIEDYNDSGSDDDRRQSIPDIAISLQEFLDVGYTEEKTQIANKLMSRSDSVIKEGKFISRIVDDDDPGCITDCENYDTSGDEIPYELVSNNNNNNTGIRSGCTPDPGDIKISDKYTKNEKIFQDFVSDAEDEGACALCMCNNSVKNTYAEGGNLSEVEDFYFSGEEEIVQFEGSDSDDDDNEYVSSMYPVIDVTFVPEENRNKCLEIPLNNIEESLTDIEKLNSSDSEASTESNHPFIPTARASFGSLTDIEDLDLGDAAELLAEIQQIRDLNIPEPVREITITKENDTGTPVTNVMPLQENLYLGIHNNYVDKGLTDTEDISCNEEEDYTETISSPSIKDENPNIIQAFVENANVQNSESVKTTSLRKIEIENEPVTDVEEIFMAGTVRRRKNKSKSQNKSKSKYLDIKNNGIEQSNTDVEELVVSDFECSTKVYTDSNKENSNSIQVRIESPELKTDIEYISGEDADASGTISDDDRKSDISVPGQENYYSTITSTIEALTQYGMAVKRKPERIIRPREQESSGFNSQCPTDIEDIQLQSDVEENALFYETYSRADTISPGELQELLNDNGMSVVHEKCGKSFNVDDEKNYIKGMNNCTETQTDVEYLDEEILIDKKQSMKSNVEEEITAVTKVVFEGQPKIYEPEEGDNYDYIQYEAATLVDSILEQSIMIVNAQQCNDYNSESEQYAITCDVNGIDMVKSPTIESLSGKSFDDNMSINDDNNIVNIPPPPLTTNTITTELIVTTTSSSSVDELNDNNYSKNISNDQNIIVNEKPNEENIIIDCERNKRSEKNFDRIERKFERLSSQLDDLEESAIHFDTDFDNMLSKDDVSNLQSDFSKISWDESVSGTTTAADVGLSTPDNDLQDLPTETSGDTARSETEIPKPTPRISKTLQSDIVQVQEEYNIKKSEIQKESKIPVKIITKVEAVVKDVDFKQSKKFWESLESSTSSSGPVEIQPLMPVPKPRSTQFKISDTTTEKIEESISTPLIKLTKGDDSISLTSAKSSSQDSKISSEQQVEYSETSSMHTSLEDDKHKEDDSVMSDDKIEDETYPDLDKLDKKSFDEEQDNSGVKTVQDEEEIGEKQASFYIGESSMNIITKSSTDKKNDYAFDNKGYEGTLDEDHDDKLKNKTDDTETIEEIQKDDIKILEHIKSESIPEIETIIMKNYETEILSMEQEKSPTRIFRQDSETRNDILECETFLEREKTYSTERDSSIDFKKESVEGIEDIVEEHCPSSDPSITNLLCKFIEEEQGATSRILSHEIEKGGNIIKSTIDDDIRLEEIVAQFSYAEILPTTEHKKEETFITKIKTDGGGSSSTQEKTLFEEMKTDMEERCHGETKTSTSKTEQTVHETTLKDHKQHTIEHVYFEEQVTPILQEAVKEEIPTHVIGIVESQVLKEHSEYNKNKQEKSEITTKQMYSAAEIVENKKFEEVGEHEIRLEATEVREEKSKLEKDEISLVTIETDFSKIIKRDDDEINKTHTDFTEKVKKSEETHKILHKTDEDEKFKETTTTRIEKSEEITKSDQKKLDLNLDKSELELSEKSFSKASKYEESFSSSSTTDQKPVLSPVKGFKGFTAHQESKERFKKSLLIEPSQVDQTMVEQTIEEVKESLDAVQEELIEVVKDGKLIKESPSEFEFKLLPHIKCSTDTIQESFHEETSSLQISDQSSKDSSKPEKSEDKSKTQIIDTSKIIEDVTTSLSSSDDPSKLEVVHRVRKEIKTDSLNRWSIPDLDQSSSGDTSSQYQSFEKTDSRPLSSDVENLLHSSEYQTAQDASLLPESTTEYISAVSTLDHSGKTISSRESMKSLDSESSANLGSIEISELSETLVPSTAEGDIEDDFDADDSDKFCGILMEDFKKDDEPITSQMKRSQEMTFEQEPQNGGRARSIESPDGNKEAAAEEEEDYHSKFGTSIDDSRLEEIKFPSSLEDGSILSMSLSSASNVDTVVENIGELASSLGASSLAGIDMNVFIRDDYTGTSFEELSKTEKIDNMVMITSTGKEDDDTNYASTQITTTVVMPPADEASEFEPKRKGHKRNESTAFAATEFLKGIEATKAAAKGTESSFEDDEEIKELTQYKEEKKDSESESDYDQYESEYSRAYKLPLSQKKSKEKGMETFEKEQEPEKRPFTPSQSVSEPIIEDASEEFEPMEEYERRPSQNMQDYSNIPDITITEDLKKYTEDGEEILDEPIEEEEGEFKDKVLYKVKTQEELHKADDTPLHYAKEQEYSITEDKLQELIQRQYESKVADITAKYSVDDDDDKADSPDSFEMLEQPDISDEFVIIEEVAKEADEFDTEGKGISIKNIKYVQKHDEEVEKILVKSAPAAPNEGSILYREEMNFDFEDSPPTGQEQEEGENSDAAAINKRWVEMQLSDNASHLRYPYEIGGGILEDIKEEDTEFEVGSSRISSFKDSFSSTPEYDVLAGRKYFTREHDNASMSSLQEFESLEQAISLENRRLHHQGHQGSQDSLSNGSFNRRYIQRSGGQGDDISLSSLTDFEGLENACIEAHLIEIKAKEEAALLLSRSDESNKSNTSNGETKSSTKTVTTTVTTVAQVQQSTSSEKSFPKTPQEIEALIKSKLEECEEESSNLMEVSTDSLELGMKKSKSSNGDGIDKKSSGSCDSLEINKSTDIMTSSIDSFEISKDVTARSSRSDVDSLEQQILQDVRRDSVDSIELEQAIKLHKTETDYHTGDHLLKDPKITSVSTTTTVINQGPTQIVTTRTITSTSTTSSSQQQDEPKVMMIKDISSDSLNLKTDPEQLLTSTESLEHTSSTATNATYQNENDSLMSGSMTSCGSNTLIDTLDSNYAEMYQSGTSSSQFLYEETRNQTQTHSKDGEKRYEYFEIFEKDLEKFDTTKPKSGDDASPEPKQDEHKK